MTAAPFTQLDERALHHTHAGTLVAARFRGPDGAEFDRQFIRSPGAVGAVALLADSGTGLDVATVLISQYRAAIDDDMIEIPAGMRDVPGEAVDETARRELAEETGLIPAALEPLAEMSPSSGMTDAVTTIFLATGCRMTERRPEGPEELLSELLTVPLREAVGWVLDGRITDAKTSLGLLLAERRLHGGG